MCGHPVSFGEIHPFTAVQYVLYCFENKNTYWAEGEAFSPAGTGYRDDTKGKIITVLFCPIQGQRKAGKKEK